MKKITLFILALSLSFAGFSQDGDSDYKWLVGAGTGADITFGDETMGAINAHALYAFTDKIMVGGELGVPLGGDADVSFSAAARFYAMDNIFLVGKYNLTEDDMGADVGVGYGWDVADNVDFSPTLTYNTEMEEMSLSLGFSIRF